MTKPPLGNVDKTRARLVKVGDHVSIMTRFTVVAVRPNEGNSGDIITLHRSGIVPSVLVVECDRNWLEAALAIGDAKVHFE